MEYFDFGNRHFVSDDICTADGYVIVHSPENAVCVPPLTHSRRSLEAHINYINANGIDSARVVAEDIGFLRRCPGLERLWIQPARSAKDFDYSPLYDMPNVESLVCDTEYGMLKSRDDKYSTADIDFSRINGLRELSVSGAGGRNIEKVRGLRRLTIQGKAGGFRSFRDMDVSALETIYLCQTAVKDLKGLENARMLRQATLAHNRSLADISALAGDPLEKLEIEACGKIVDLSVLNALPKMISLTLRGRNTLPDISFVRNMPELKVLVLYMKSIDGDMSACDSVPYVNLEDHRHYNRKNAQCRKETY